mmetsp:Transcript_23296/g.75488  ORF Transcript_23296/g.75488 Transcript_23296/m.75488 type:complete len:259 (-) Transcript_23296:74-850(-)
MGGGGGATSAAGRGGCQIAAPGAGPARGGRDTGGGGTGSPLPPAARGGRRDTGGGRAGGCVWDGDAQWGSGSGKHHLPVVRFGRITPHHRSGTPGSGARSGASGITLGSVGAAGTGTPLGVEACGRRAEGFVTAGVGVGQQLVGQVGAELVRDRNRRGQLAPPRRYRPAGRALPGVVAALAQRRRGGGAHLMCLLQGAHALACDDSADTSDDEPRGGLLSHGAEAAADAGCFEHGGEKDEGLGRGEEGGEEGLEQLGF